MEKRKGLSGNCLFFIAFLLLFINEFLYIYGSTFELNTVVESLQWYITRPYAVILFFLVAEGMYYTKDRVKYILILLVIAIVSEFLFDYTFNNTLIEFTSQNDMFDLFNGALTIFLYDKFKGNRPMQIISFIVLCVVSSLFNFPYNVCAVSTTLAFYVLRNNEKRFYIIALIVVLTSFALHTIYLIQGRDALKDYLPFAIEQSCAVFAIPLIAKYNGQVGTKLPRWLYCITYPVHILIIILIFKVIA